MAKYAYIRVSTNKQSYDQQIQDFNRYGINLSDLDGVVEEKETTNKGYEDREFNTLLNKCKSGDIIYAASTDRIGRDFLDMMKLMKAAADDGIEIIACKQNLSIARDDAATRIIVAVTAIMDEDEKKRIQHRTANKKAWQREQIAEKGCFVIESGPNAGNTCTYVGRPKWKDMSDSQKKALIQMQEAAHIAQAQAAIKWRDNSQAVHYACLKRSEGWKLQQIVDEIGKLYDGFKPKKEGDENPWATPTGCKPQKGTISKWLRETNPLLAR